MTIPETIDPAAVYVVRVRRVLPRGPGVILRPNVPARVLGAALEEICEDVLEAALYTPREPGACVIPPEGRERQDVTGGGA